MLGTRVRLSRIAVGVLLVTTLSGCPARWRFVFINEDRVPLQVVNGGLTERLEPGEQWRTDAQVWNHELEPASIIVQDENGVPLHSTAADSILSDGTVPAEYPDRFVRVRREELRAIPDPEGR